MCLKLPLRYFFYITRFSPATINPNVNLYRYHNDVLTRPVARIYLLVFFLWARIKNTSDRQHVLFSDFGRFCGYYYYPRVCLYRDCIGIQRLTWFRRDLHVKVIAVFKFSIPNLFVGTPIILHQSYWLVTLCSDGIYNYWQ